VNPFDAATVATLRGVFALVVPEVVLVVAACVLFLGGTVRAGRTLWGTAALAGIGAAALAMAVTPAPDLTALVPTVSSVWPDRLAFLTRVLALGGGAALVLLSWAEVPDRQAADYHGCLLLVTAGTALVGLANDFITLFLALELISIPTYVLLYLPRHDRPAQEAAVKYFLLSAFSSALVLFGFSYLYGVTGTTNLPALIEALTSAETGGAGAPPLALVGVVVAVAGLGFRITAVPFHFYAPDVYQGTATAAAALLAYVPKVAGFVALIRLLGDVGATTAGLPLTLGYQVPLLLWILAAITMTLGNVLALWQDNVQRLLAYSSVAHSGYMLIGLTVAPHFVGRAGGVVPGGVESVLFYLAAYGAMTVGAFGVLAILNSSDRRVERVDDLAGLGRTHPALGLLMTLFLFSLIGLPLTAGFAGKYFLFMGALAAPRDGLFAAAGQADAALGALARWLVLIGAVNAAVGAYYYLRIIGAMYLRGALKPLDRPRSSAGLAALWACAGLTVWLGVAPSAMLRLTQGAATPVEVKR
jgi:NADH-quinone oxidoreductase subunit N